MSMKAVKDLQIGDRLVLTEPDGIGQITRKERSGLFIAEGGCWQLEWKVIDGAHKGETVKDQHHGGAMGVNVVDDEK